MSVRAHRVTECVWTAQRLDLRVRRGAGADDASAAAAKDEDVGLVCAVPDVGVKILVTQEVAAGTAILAATEALADGESLQTDDAILRGCLVTQRLPRRGVR
jgi:hypothetical protein